MKLSVEDVQGRNCLLDFHGMCYTRDKLCYFVRKWQTLIEGNVDVKTTDGYSIRVFCIGFTTTRHNQREANCYAQTSQIRKIRKRMVDTIQEECSKSSLKENVKKLIASSMYREIEKKCERVFPLKDVCIRKVKVLKKPKTSSPQRQTPRRTCVVFFLCSLIRLSLYKFCLFIFFVFVDTVWGLKNDGPP